MTGECAGELRPLYDALSAIDARLGVGLSYTAFTTALGDAAVASNRVDVSKVNGEPCLRLVRYLDSAARYYGDTAETWAACSTTSCTDGLKEKWSFAHQALVDARALLP